MATVVLTGTKHFNMVLSSVLCSSIFPLSAPCQDTMADLAMITVQILILKWHFLLLEIRTHWVKGIKLQNKAGTVCATRG